LLFCVVKSGIVQEAWRLVKELQSISDEDTVRWLDEIKRKKASGRDDFAKSLRELNEKMAGRDSEWTDVTPPELRGPSTIDGTAQAPSDTRPAGPSAPVDSPAKLSDPAAPSTEEKAAAASASSSSSSSRSSMAQPQSKNGQEWWEKRKKYVTVVGYRDTKGNIEYLWMDISLEEGTEDQRFLAYEDKEDAKTMLAALRAIAAKRGIPVPVEDNTTGHFHCLVSPENLRMLEEKQQREVLVLRKGEVPLRIGMDELEIRTAYLQAIFRRPRLPRTPRQWPKQQSCSSSSGGGSTSAMSHRAGVDVPGELSGAAPSRPPEQRPGETVVPEVLQRTGGPGNGSSSSSIGAAVTESPKQRAVTDGWWSRLPSVWVIRLLYSHGAAGVFQCDVSMESESVALHIIAFEDREAAETVCMLSQRWTDLTSGVVRAEVTGLPPTELSGIAAQTESGVTVLKAHHLANLTPSVGPDQLADMIMAARSG